MQLSAVEMLQTYSLKLQDNVINAAEFWREVFLQIEIQHSSCW